MHYIMLRSECNKKIERPRRPIRSLRPRRFNALNYYAARDFGSREKPIFS